MKKLFALLLTLVLLGACAAPVVVDEPAVATEEITTTEAVATTLPAPREWPGVPQAYWAVLDEFYAFVQSVRHGDPEPNWGNLPFTGFPHNIGQPGNASFALVDINHDGRQELVLFHETNMLALFTYYEGVAIVLEGWGHHRERVIMAANGTIFTRGFAGANQVLHSSYILEPDAIQLTELTHYFASFMTDEPTFTDIDGEQHLIIEGQEPWRDYLNPPNPMQFEFVPLGQQ